MAVLLWRSKDISETKFVRRGSVVFQLLPAGVTDKFSTNQSSRPSDLKQWPLCSRGLSTLCKQHKKDPGSNDSMFHQAEQASEFWASGFASFLISASSSPHPPTFTLLQQTAAGLAQSASPLVQTLFVAGFPRGIAHLAPLLHDSQTGWYY